MNRRTFLQVTLGLAAAAGFTGWRVSRANAESTVKPSSKVNKTKAEWKQILPAAAYAVLFEEGTERSGTSPLEQEKRPGKFICAACNQPIFDASKKFESGTGWPSFWEALPGSLETKSDYKLMLPRTEYHCSRCGGHQGHVFDDGPPPSGKRYCNNGVALHFVPAGEALPALVS